jgi:hypothetical protein
VREVIALPDPVGTELQGWTRPNGLRFRKLRVPIGVIGIIYESRPNVTVDCAILCLKSGNASILRGGKECFHTNTALAELIRQALVAAALPADAVQLIPTTDRNALTTLLTLDKLVHCIIPRGGESLIRYVVQNSTIPVIKHYTGVCFVYVDRDADPALAETILVNAKVQRPGVCNAAEQLLVHTAVAESLLPRLASALVAKGVQLRCDSDSAAILAKARLAHSAAAPADFTGGVPRPDYRRARRRLAGNRHRHDQSRRLRPQRRHRDERRVRRAALSGGRRQRGRLLEREHALQRRVRVRLRCRDRNQHRPPARARPDGPARALHLQIRHRRHRPDPPLAGIRPHETDHRI